MSVLLAAAVVGVLLGTGTFLVLRRAPINLILGLALLSYGVNLLLFSTSGLDRGDPPIIDKKAFDGEIDSFVDPLPQALILTAIVISFGVTAFTVVLVNRRNVLSDVDADPETTMGYHHTADPFGPVRDFRPGFEDEEEDYLWLVDDAAVGDRAADDDDGPADGGGTDRAESAS